MHHHPPSHGLGRALVAALLCACLAPTLAHAGDAADEYRRALRSLDRGRLEDARLALQTALAREPRSSEVARSYGAREIGYFPYLQLSVIAYRQGDIDEAQHQLARELAEGAVQRTEAGRTLVARQELLLENLAFLRQAAAAPGEGAPAEVRRRTAGDLEREVLLATQVATECGERPAASAAGRPWYYHWLLARKLSEHRDWIGALEHVAQAIDLKDTPGAFQRTYGMGFVDYRPWLELGRLHHQLGNHACARDALQLSVALEPLDERDAALARERAELLAGAEARAAGP